jgi:hypothetical protein
LERPKWIGRGLETVLSRCAGKSGYPGTDSLDGNGQKKRRSGRLAEIAFGVEARAN